MGGLKFFKLIKIPLGTASGEASPRNGQQAETLEPPSRSAPFSVLLPSDIIHTYFVSYTMMYYKRGHTLTLLPTEGTLPASVRLGPVEETCEISLGVSHRVDYEDGFIYSRYTNTYDTIGLCVRFNRGKDDGELRNVAYRYDSGRYVFCSLRSGDIHSDRTLEVHAYGSDGLGSQAGQVLLWCYAPAGAVEKFYPERTLDVGDLEKSSLLRYLDQVSGVHRENEYCVSFNNIRDRVYVSSYVCSVGYVYIRVRNETRYEVVSCVFVSDDSVACVHPPSEYQSKGRLIRVRPQDSDVFIYRIHSLYMMYDVKIFIQLY